jgi:protein ImuB
LGDDQVLRLQPLADHRPECASVAVPVSLAHDRQASVPTAATRVEGPLPHPVWLLPQAQPLAEHKAMPLFEGLPLQLLAGPERIESGWWDGALATRDYFIAQAADGALVWVYRARLPVTDAAQPLWYLQGWFG